MGAGRGSTFLLRPVPIAAGFLALGLAQLALFWPGIVSYDVVVIFADWSRGIVGDWHPPILIRLWSLLMAMGLRGTGPLLAIQLTLFWVGIALLAGACARRGRWGKIVALLVATLLPPVFGWMAEIVKDSQMTAAMLFATGVVGWYRLQDRRTPPATMAVALVALLYAVLLRANAVFAILPLAVLLFRTAGRARSWSFCLLMLAAAASAPLLNNWVFEARTDHAERSQQVFDLAGIAHRAPLPTIADVPPAIWRQTEEKGCYTPFGWDNYSTVEGCDVLWPLVKARSLDRIWIGAIAAHPRAYAAHRLTHWNMSLRFLVPAGEPRGTGQKYSTPNPWHLGNGSPATAAANYRAQKVVAQMPIGWPFAWDALGLVLLWAAAATPRSGFRDVAVALAASGVAQSASLLLVSVSADQRYHAWPIAAIAVATALLAAEPLPRRRLALGGAAILLLCLCAAVARLVMTPNWPSGL